MAKKYGVTFTFSRTGYYDAEVEANGIEDAKRIAKEIGDDPDKFIDYILEMDSNCLWEPVEVDDIEVWETEQDNEPKKNNKEDPMKKFNVGDTINVNATDVCPICGSKDVECTEHGWEHDACYGEMYCLNCHSDYTLWMMPSHVVIQNVLHPNE